MHVAEFTPTLSRFPHPFDPPAVAAPLPVRVWLAGIGAMLRANMGDFPDAIWLATPAFTLAVERDEAGRWSVSDLPTAPAGLRLRDTGSMPILQEVADSAIDPSLDTYPTAAMWPMSRRVCRIVFRGTTPAVRESVMMLVGSLPGRMSGADRAVLEEWSPAAGAVLEMALDAHAQR